MSDEPNKSLADLGVTINELLRYAYAGLLPAVLAVMLYWEQLIGVKGGTEFKSSESIGLLLLFVFVLAGGTVVYALHRTLLGLWLFEYLHDSFHRGVVEVWRNWWYTAEEPGYTSKRHFLEQEYGVRRDDSLNVFRLLREAVFDQKSRMILYRQHSEAYTLYITAAIVMGADLIMWWKLGEEVNGVGRCTYHKWFCTIANLCWVAGLAYDIVISKQECMYLKKLSRHGDDKRELGKIVTAFQYGYRSRPILSAVSHGIAWTVCGGGVALLVFWTVSPERVMNAFWTSGYWWVLLPGLLTGLVVGVANGIWPEPNPTM